MWSGGARQRGQGHRLHFAYSFPFSQNSCRRAFAPRVLATTHTGSALESAPMLWRRTGSSHHPTRGWSHNASALSTSKVRCDRCPSGINTNPQNPHIGPGAVPPDARFHLIGHECAAAQRDNPAVWPDTVPPRSEHCRLARVLTPCVRGAGLTRPLTGGGGCPRVGGGR